MYHAVSDAWDDSLAIPIGEFDLLLARLVRGRRRGATAAEVAARPSDPRLLHVTFDDAFASVQNALPTLRRLRIPATIFVCTDLAEGGAPLAIAELDRVTQRDELRTLDWDELRAMSGGRADRDRLTHEDARPPTETVRCRAEDGARRLEGGDRGSPGTAGAVPRISVRRGGRTSPPCGRGGGIRGRVRSSGIISARRSVPAAEDWALAQRHPQSAAEQDAISCSSADGAARAGPVIEGRADSVTIAASCGLRPCHGTRPCSFLRVRQSP